MCARKSTRSSLLPALWIRGAGDVGGTNTAHRLPWLCRVRVFESTVYAYGHVWSPVPAHYCGRHLRHISGSMASPARRRCSIVLANPAAILTLHSIARLTRPSSKSISPRGRAIPGDSGHRTMCVDNARGVADSLRALERMTSSARAGAYARQDQNRQLIASGGR